MAIPVCKWHNIASDMTNPNGHLYHCSKECDGQNEKCSEYFIDLKYKGYREDELGEYP